MRLPRGLNLCPTAGIPAGCHVTRRLLSVTVFSHRKKNLPLCRKQASNSADVSSFYFSKVRAVAKYAPVWRFGLRALQSSEGESALCHLCRGSVGVWTKAFYWQTCRCRGSDVYTCPKSPPASSGAPCGRHPTGHKTSVPGFRGVCLAFQPH